MQQPPQMIPMMPSMPPSNITTEQIQKYLDENKKLILAILDNQHLGKLAECAQYQAQLQKNLMYLAAIADAQPQAVTAPPQMAPSPAMSQGGYNMQHPQVAAAAMAAQPGIFPPRMPSPFNIPHPMQDAQQIQQQGIQAHMGMRLGGVNHSPLNRGNGSSSIWPLNAGINDKQDTSNPGTASTDGQGSSASKHNCGKGESS